MDLTIISILFGGILLSAVVFKYLKTDRVENVTLTCFLTFFGFALVASPAWTSISWKSQDAEFQLVRETTEQMDDYVRILRGYEALQLASVRYPEGEQPDVSFAVLAESLRIQKEKIELALSEGDIEAAIEETKSGSQLIDEIADQISAS